MSDEKTTRADDDIIPAHPAATERATGTVIRAGVQPGAPPSVPSSQQALVAPVSAGNELIINNQVYKVLRRLGASGESEVFLTKKGDEEFVVKLYYPTFAPRLEIAKKLKGLTHPDIISLIDYGYVQDRFAEVMEYARGGSVLTVAPIRDLQRLKVIIREIVNGLNFCHSKGIIHRDIKPQNIFFRDPERTDVVIGDFGISSILDEGYSKRLTGKARTTLYAPPEVFQSIGGKAVIDKAVDYYALGITLIHLWLGAEPFQGLGEYGIMRVKMEGRVEVPDDMPKDLQVLIKGLLAVNPARRWGFDEVQKWLRGETVALKHEGPSEYPPFIFAQVQGKEVVATDPKGLADLLERHRDLGKGHLYRKAISAWLKDRNQFLYVSIENIVEDEYPKDRDPGLTKAIYVLDPERGFLGVDGRHYHTPDEIARCLEANFDHYKQDLQRPNADFYLYLEARGYKEEAEKFRRLFRQVSPHAALNTLILALEGGENLRVGGLVFRSPGEVLSAPEDVKKRLLLDLQSPETKISLWLQRFPDLAQTINRFRALKRNDFQAFRYALDGGVEVGNLVLKEPQDVEKVLRERPESLNLQVVPEVNYWLRYYRDTSFNEIALSVLRELKGEKFILVASYALSNLEDQKHDLFQTLRTILDLLSTEWATLDLPADAISRISERAAQSIEAVADSASKQGGATAFLEDWLKVMKPNDEKEREFWREVLKELREDLFVTLASSVDLNAPLEFARAYERFVKKIEELGATGRLRERLEAANKAVEDQWPKIEENIRSQREERKAATEKAFLDRRLEKVQEAESSDRAKALRSRAIWATITLAVLSVLAVYLRTLPKRSFGDIATSAVGIGCGVVGALIGAIVSLAESENPFGGGCLGLIIGMLLGTVVVLASPYAAIVAFLVFVVTAVQYSRIIRKAHQLTPEEEAAYNESLRRIDEYYQQKAEFERAQAVVKALSAKR